MNEGRKVSVNEGSNGRLMRVKEEERNKGREYFHDYRDDREMLSRKGRGRGAV